MKSRGAERGRLREAAGMRHPLEQAHAPTSLSQVTATSALCPRRYFD
jgi:hypothetical protein